MLALFNMIGGKTLAYGAAGLALLAALYWFERKLEDIGALNAALTTAQQVNRANAAELDQLHADAGRAAKATAAAFDQERRRRTEQSTLSEEIDHAPPNAHATVSPLILSAIGGLFGPVAAAAGPNQGSGPAGAGRPVGLPAGTGSPGR
jgi:hypothetical protein